MSSLSSTALSRTSHVIMALLTLPVAAYAALYLIPDMPGLPDNILANRWGAYGLPLHAGLGAAALLIGPFQFMQSLRSKAPGVHRAMGGVYVVACLVSALAGFVLATGNTSGVAAGLGFALAAIVWTVCTARGVSSIVAGQYAAHRRWMIRSYAMTFSAVTLRIQLGAALASGLDFAEFYPILAFSAWIPNLIVAELWLLVRDPSRAAQNQPASFSAE